MLFNIGTSQNRWPSVSTVAFFLTKLLKLYFFIFLEFFQLLKRQILCIRDICDYLVQLMPKFTQKRYICIE